MRELAGATLAASLPAIAALLVLGVAIYAPITQAIAGYPSGEWGYRLLFAICHQYPLRSFWLLDHPMAICARCTGGYLGVTAGTIMSLSQCVWQCDKLGRVVLLGLFFFVLGFGDALLKVSVGIDGSNVWRLLTGFVGGLGIGLLVNCLPYGLAGKIRRLKHKLGGKE